VGLIAGNPAKTEREIMHSHLGYWKLAKGYFMIDFNGKLFEVAPQRIAQLEMIRMGGFNG
jgi:cell division septal protein FtsQ